MNEYVEIRINDHIKAMWDKRKVRCKGPNCGALIGWGITQKGKRIPFDIIKARPDSPKNEAHWSTCPDAQSFRKKAKQPEEPKPVDEVIK